MDASRGAPRAQAQAPRRRAVLRGARAPRREHRQGGPHRRPRQGAVGPRAGAAGRRAAQGAGTGLRLRASAAVRHLPAHPLAPPQEAARGGCGRRRAARPLGLLPRTPRRYEGAVRMAVLRPHLALTVSDVDRSIPFYEALFGTKPEKIPDGYAKFSVTEPALNFTLNQGARAELGAFNHAGIQVAGTDDVLAAKLRLVKAGLATFDEMDTTCCYARQDKIW